MKDAVRSLEAELKETNASTPVVSAVMAIKGGRIAIRSHDQAQKPHD